MFVVFRNSERMLLEYFLLERLMLFNVLFKEIKCLEIKGKYSLEEYKFYVVLCKGNVYLVY